MTTTIESTNAACLPKVEGCHATISEYAALEFEAWEHEEGDWEPPNNEEWNGLVNPHLVIIRAAWRALHRTKPELIVTAEKLIADDMLEGFVDRLSESANYFKGLAMILETAEARMIGATSVIVERTDTQNGGGQS